MRGLAHALRLTDDDLRADLRAGLSVPEIAVKHGLAVQTVYARKDALAGRELARRRARAEEARLEAARRVPTHVTGPMPLPVNPYCRPCGARVGPSEIAVCPVRGCRRKGAAC